jgi:DDE superfamily endonuclease
MLGVATHPASREETAVLHTLPRPGSGLQTLPVTGRDLAPAPDPAVFASAVARYRALAGLRGFRQSLYECLDARADALFELTDAVLCADHAVTSLVQLCLEPEFTRGHGALYDALSAGRIDDERFFSLLASELPQAVDGPEALAWIAERDVIDHGLLEKALAGLPADDASQVRDACARWSRLRFAVDATAYPRPDAWCSPGREHVHKGACPCRGSSKTAPGWEYQFAKPSRPGPGRPKGSREGAAGYLPPMEPSRPL